MRHFIPLLVTWVGAVYLGSAPLTAVEPGIDDFLTGLDALERGRFAEAATALSKAVQADDENPDYLTARGVAFALSEKLDDAHNDLTRANRLRPQHQATRLWLATVVGMQGDFENDVDHFPAATRDLYETSVRMMSREYGAPDYSRRTLRREPEAHHNRQREEAKAKFASLAAEFVQRIKPVGPLLAALKRRAIDRYKAGNVALAMIDFQRALREAPDDFEMITFLAGCKLGTGSPEGARADYTYVLTHKPDWTSAYIGRGLAHAELGNAEFARHDFEVARELDAKAVARFEPRLDKALASIAPVRKKQQLAAMLDSLRSEAERDAGLDELRPRALELVKAVHAGRLRADETYQRGLQTLRAQTARRPRDADRLADLGEYLYTNALVVLIEWVEPRAERKPYRPQATESQKAELAEAEKVLDRALAIQRDHAKAMAYKAACLIERSQWSDAEQLLRRALELKPRDPVVLQLFARVMDRASALAASTAEDLLSVKSWSDWQYIYYRYPSEAEKRLAQEYLQQAKKLWELATQSLKAAAEAERGTARGYYYQALLASRNNDIQGMRTALEHAVEKDRKFVQAWHDLSRVYGALEMRKEQYEAQLMAANLVHTTAASMLKLAWLQVGRSAYRSAAEALDRGADFDPADPRVAAYRGVIAREKGKDEESATWFVVAALIAEADVSLRGVKLREGNGPPIDPDDVSRFLAAAEQAGTMLLKLGKTEIATRLLRINVNAYQRMGRADHFRPLAGGMLPQVLDPGANMPTAPNAETLDAWTRLRLGEALLASRKFKQADAQFRWVAEFESRKPPVMDVGQMIRLPAKLAGIRRVELALARGDPAAAKWALLHVGKPRFLPPEEQEKLEALERRLQGVAARDPSTPKPVPRKLTAGELERCRSNREALVERRRLHEIRLETANRINNEYLKTAMRESIADIDRQLEVIDEMLRTGQTLQPLAVDPRSSHALPTRVDPQFQPPSQPQPQSPRIQADPTGKSFLRQQIKRYEEMLKNPRYDEHTKERIRMGLQVLKNQLGHEQD